MIPPRKTIVPNPISFNDSGHHTASNFRPQLNWKPFKLLPINRTSKTSIAQLCCINSQSPTQLVAALANNPARISSHHCVLLSSRLICVPHCHNAPVYRCWWSKISTISKRPRNNRLVDTRNDSATLIASHSNESSSSSRRNANFFCNK